MATGFLILSLVEKLLSPDVLSPGLQAATRNRSPVRGIQEMTFNKSLQHQDQDNRYPDLVLPICGWFWAVGLTLEPFWHLLPMSEVLPRMHHQPSLTGAILTPPSHQWGKQGAH